MQRDKWSGSSTLYCAAPVSGSRCLLTWPANRSGIYFRTLSNFCGSGQLRITSGFHDDSLNCRDGNHCARLKLVIRCAADRVVNDSKPVIRQTQHARHQFRSADKFTGHHADRWGADFFAADRVMQTARRTTASVSKTGNGNIPFPCRIDDVLLRRCTVIGLGFPHHVGYLKPLLE